MFRIIPRQFFQYRYCNASAISIETFKAIVYNVIAASIYTFLKPEEQEIQMKLKRIIALSAALLLILPGCLKKDELRLGTGNAGGTYYSYGTELSNALKSNKENLQIKVCSTAGSAANIRLIEDGYLKLAFAQSDMLCDAANGTGIFKEKHRGYSAVAGLYWETCQIVVPADSEIKTVSDLYGKRVSLGEEESGVLQNAKRILFAYGLSEDMVKAQYLSFNDSADALKNGSIDAFFCTAGAPTPAVTKLSETMPVRLLPLDPAQAERIIKEYGGYNMGTVKAGTYNGQSEDVQVLEVKNVLIASNELDASVVKTLAKGVLEHQGSGVENGVIDVPIGFHKGAAEYYREHGIDVEENTTEAARKGYASSDAG